MEVESFAKLLSLRKKLRSSKKKIIQTNPRVPALLDLVELNVDLGILELKMKARRHDSKSKIKREK